MAFTDGEILIYTDLLDRVCEVIYIRTDGEMGNHLVKHDEREIWLRPAQVKGTGRIHRAEAPSVGSKKKGWTLGVDPVPEYAIKKRGRSAK